MNRLAFAFFLCVAGAARPGPWRGPSPTNLPSSQDHRADRAVLRPGARGGYSSYPTPAPHPQRLREITDSSLWPQPVYESHDSNSEWTQQGADVAAVSADCPFLDHGPSSSLGECQYACMNDGACNEINWNPAIPDCVMRVCADPAHPALSPTPGYSVYTTTKGYFSVNAATFAFSSVGFTDDVLLGAMARYRSITFVYGLGNVSTAEEALAAGGPGASVSGLAVNVLTTDNLLREGIDQSYSLNVSGDNADGSVASVLTASTVYGALRGLETFSQLMQYNLTAQVYLIQSSVVWDAPRFPFRGVLVDTARRFMSVSVLKSVINAMEGVKLESLHLHLSDDQSWPLVIEAWPRLAQQGAYSNVSHTYSHDDVRELVTYGRMRGVRIIPEFDSPSHSGTIEHAYKEFTALAYDSDNNTFACLLDVSKEATFDFLASVWGEIASIFPEQTLMLGSDEVWDCWSESPAVVTWMNARNWTWIDAYYYYERRMVEIARSLGRNSLLWLDSAGFPANFTNSYNDYPDVTFNVWTGCYSGQWQDDAATFVAQNASIVVSGPYYITQQNGAPSTPHFTPAQMYEVDLLNFTGGATPAGQRLVKGGQLCAWDDAAGTDSGDIIVSLTPYLFAVGEAWWSPENATKGSSFPEQRAHVHRCRLIQRGLPSHPLYSSASLCPFEYEATLPAWGL